MHITPYLSFNGNCEEAFAFYERCFGGTRGSTFIYGASPMAGQVPPDWQNKVMHGSITIGELVVMGADVADFYEAPKGISLSVQLTNAAEAERIFGELAADGCVQAPLEKTFWAERFGMVVDRFGIPWLINCGNPTPPQSVIATEPQLSNSGD